MLVQKIIIGVFCAVAVAAILEYVGRKRRARRRQAEASGEEVALDSFDTAFQTITRLFWAVFIGVVMGGLTAGILQEFGTGEIEFFSPLANVLIAFWTALVWWYVSRRDLI